MRRFQKGDVADLNEKLERCNAFETKWEPERMDYSQRLDGLCSHFEKMLDQAIKVLSGIQFMTDEANAFEKDENLKRVNIPAVFSIG
jgi:hypothetical protein